MGIILKSFKQFLTERAKFSKTIYVYHGTSSKNLRSILKQGLIMNRQEGYGSTDTTITGYRLTSLKGVYLTTSVYNAENAAAEVVQRGEDKLIIICKVQQKMGAMDEDKLLLYIDENKFVRFIRNDLVQNKDDHIKEFTKETLNLILRHNEISVQVQDKLQPMIREYYSLIYNYVTLDKKADTAETEEKQDSIIKFMKSLEVKIKNSQTKMTRLLKSMKDENLRIEDNITFSGTNKIVGIYNMSNYRYWGDVGDTFDASLPRSIQDKIMQNSQKVNNPMEVLG